VTHDLLLPPFVALLLCCFLGYPLARLALPAELRGERWLLVPLLGLALLLNVCAALTTTTALRPLQIALGMAVLALPLNLWLLLQRKNQEPRTKNQEAQSREPRTENHRTTEPQNREPRTENREPGNVLFSAAVWALGGAAFALAILPPWRWGVALPIGVNWDAAEFYVPLGRALQIASQRDLGAIGRNPLVTIISTPPVSGRIHAFSYLHALASSLANADPAHSYVGMMALVLALVPPAVYALGRALGLPRLAALLGAALAALGWLPLWVAYNGFSNHLMALPLLPAALGASVVALRAGGWRAVLAGALLTAGLATGYYPAMSAYVLFFAPAALWLLARGPGWRPVLRRGLALAGLSFLLSGAAQAYFFLKSGFLQEMAEGVNGFQVNELVGLADMLGLNATFNREALSADARLVLLALVACAALGLAAIVGRRAPLLLALLLGAAAYQGYTAATGYYYGFYKGATFAAPLLALLLGAGVAALWRLGARWRLVGWALCIIAVAAIGLVLALNIATVRAVEARYTAAGPQLWSLDEADALELRAEVPPAASVLVVPPPRHPVLFNSLISYALLGHPLSGRYPTGYNRINTVDNDPPPEMALLPEEAAPGDYGYRPADLRWAGADMRLYGRAPGVQYHRVFGRNGSYAKVTPGEPLVLRVGSRIALPGERAPDATPGDPARLVLAAASFGPATLELRGAGASERFELPGGLAQVTSAPQPLPGTVELRVLDGAPVFLWWGELCAPEACAGGAEPRDDVFAQVQAQPGASPAHAAFDVRVRTAQLPGDLPQKLTAVLALGFRPPEGGDWREAGQWVFFPSGEALRLDLDMAAIQAGLSAGGQPRDIVGAPPPAQDGSYQLSLLLANDARVVYSTKIAAWQLANGAVSKPATEGIEFEMVPLPTPATVRDAPLASGALRLRGYTLPRTQLRPGERFGLALVWQSLQKIEGDMSAHVRLADAQGRVLAEQTLALGASEHGTHTWQEGEISEHNFAFTLPAGAPAGPAALTVELRDQRGQPLSFSDGTTPLPIADLTVVR
jgi:hypothetical protein